MSAHESAPLLSQDRHQGRTMPISASRLKAIGPWLAKAWPAWLALAVIGIALVISLWLYAAEPVIRWAGLVLQLMGIATVIWGIAKTRAFFELPTFIGEIKDWLCSFPLLRRPQMIKPESIPSSEAFGNLSRLSPGLHVPRADTSEARLEAIEKDVKSFHDRIGDTQKEMDVKFQKTTDELKREEKLRQEVVSAVRDELKESHTGSMHISAMGASWLFVGVILSTAAKEIAEYAALRIALPAVFLAALLAMLLATLRK